MDYLWYNIEYLIYKRAYKNWFSRIFNYIYIYMYIHLVSSRHHMPTCMPSPRGYIYIYIIGIHYWYILLMYITNYIKFRLFIISAIQWRISLSTLRIWRFYSHLGAICPTCIPSPRGACAVKVRASPANNNSDGEITHQIK